MGYNSLILKILVLLIVFPPFSIAGEFYNVPISEEEKIFIIEKNYEYWVQSYTPPVSLGKLNKKYNEESIINAYPEAKTGFVLNAMKSKNYKHWLSFWDSSSRKKIELEDKVIDPKERMNRWDLLSSPSAQINLIKMIQVGIAQYTYLLTICEVIEGDKEEPTYLYFSWSSGVDGKWRLSQDLMNHPVFNKIISNKIGM